MTEHVFRVQTVLKPSGACMRDAVPYATFNAALDVIRKADQGGFLESATIEREDGEIYGWATIKTSLQRTAV